MIYELLLGVGAVGTLAQVFLGAAGGRHAVRAGRGAKGVRLARGAKGARGAKSAKNNAGGAALELLLGLLSPLLVFSVSLGAGATGMVLEKSLKNGTTLALLALLGGLAFYFLIARPMLGVALKFASKPAQTLADSVASDAEAMSRFDERGQGIVKLNVDGRLVRLLAQLDSPADVSPGDRLVVLSVDTKRNTCRVARL